MCVRFALHYGSNSGALLLCEGVTFCRLCGAFVLYHPSQPLSLRLHHKHRICGCHGYIQLQPTRAAFVSMRVNLVAC